VKDDRAAATLARQALGYFFGPTAPGRAPDGAKLRDIVPADPMQGYNVRRVLDHLCDIDSILELRPRFGGAAVTALARIEGIPLGVIASQPTYLGGAIDSPTSDKIARFIQLCDAHDLPMVLLVDTPGLMVGPAVEKTALVRHSARILVALANATAPFLTVVMRKAYGLGYYVLGSKALSPALLLAWPTAEFGGMGLEGAAAIIWKKDLEAIAGDAERRQALKEKTDYFMRMNTALEVGGRFEYDDVIDPAETREILAKTLRALPKPAPRDGRKRVIDTW
jgi:acetyl-CoA carboxylase carboxyltransferase component